MATITTDQFIINNLATIVKGLINEKNITLTENFLFNLDDSVFISELFDTIKGILLSIDSTSYTDGDLTSSLAAFFENDAKFSLFSKELADASEKVLFSHFNGKTDKKAIIKCIQTGAFWRVFPKAIKKCIGAKHAKSTINITDLLDSCNITITRIHTLHVLTVLILILLLIHAIVLNALT